MRPVIIESPFAGPTTAVIDLHREYLRACMRDALLRGEAPYASHGLYTQPGVLKDTDPAEREHGIQAGYAVGDALIKANPHTRVAVCVDLGLSGGMQAARERYSDLFGESVIVRRSLGGDWAERKARLLSGTCAACGSIGRGCYQLADGSFSCAGYGASL